MIANGLSNRIRHFNYAVGAAPGAGVLLVPRGLTTHGSVTPVAEATLALPSAIDTIDITSLDHIVPTLDITRIDLLKIDTEGAEVAVLRGAESTLDMVKRIVIEYHSQSLLQQVASLLDDRGFTRVLQVDVDPKRGVGLLFARKTPSTTALPAGE